MKIKITMTILMLLIVTSANAQTTASRVNEAIRIFREYNLNVPASVRITSENRPWQRQLELILSPRNASMYPNIKRDFLSFSGLSSLPSYAQVLANQNWLNWWQREIMNPSRGLDHVTGRAVDVSVRDLTVEQRRNFEQILSNMGIRVTYEDYRADETVIVHNISQATLFHCVY
ncbi:MAG: hypothetical protein FWE37_00190 [Spirochaetaceae bacterium]|nr:hypothetical protein [Spirochaetaceae bacterium]